MAAIQAKGQAYGGMRQCWALRPSASAHTVNPSPCSIPSRQLLGAAIALALTLAFIASPAHAGLFSKSQAVAAALPDAAITIVFPNRAALDFDPKNLVIETVYQPAKPEEKGVRTVTRKSRSCPVEIPIPFGCSTHKYTQPLDRQVAIRRDWISVAQPNGLVIRVPERLSGPGDYRLTELSLICPRALCGGKKPLNEWKLGFTDGAREDRVPAAMRLGVDEASTFTAAYQGKTLQIGWTRGSYAEKSQPGYAENPEFDRAVQDAAGRWHISSSAYVTYYEGACPEPSFSSGTERINPKEHASLAWVRPFKEVAHGEVYDTISYGADGKRVANKPADWNGCVMVKAQGIGGNGDNYETRKYEFEHGQLRLRRIQRYAFGVSHDETLELDAGQKPLFFQQLDYVDKTRAETKSRWSRLRHEAYPNETKPAPKVDLPLLLKEAADVLTIITPRFEVK